MAAGSLSLFHIGQDVIITGLFMQLFFFGIFMITAVVFFRRITKHPTPQSIRSLANVRLTWRSLLFALLATSIVIFVRCIFRVVEYLNGNGGYIQSHEAFAYAFDGCLMLCVMLLLNIIHPGYILCYTVEDWPLEHMDGDNSNDVFPKP
jgi:hypothetical protein